MVKKENIVPDYQVEDGPLKVELIKILRGANYFSAGPVVLTRLDLGDYDEVFSNEVEGFYERLENILPSLYEHHCSEGKPGGFLFRVRKGTLMGHIVEHVAIELQSLAGMEASYGKTRSTQKQGVYNIIFRFIDDIAGIYAAKAAVNLVNAILQKKSFNTNPVIETLIGIREERLIGPSTQSIVSEAEKRDIPVFRLDHHNLIQLGTGKYQKRIRATLTSDTHFIAVENSMDKFLSTLSLKDSGLPVPDTLMANNFSEVLDFFNSANGSVVVKPMDSSKGEKVFIDIDSSEKLYKAFKICSASSSDVIVQKQIEGNTYRVLVINGCMIAATKLYPPKITGDGESTVSQLIEKLNNEEGREHGDKGKLSKILIDDNLINTIEVSDYSLSSVLPKGTSLKILSSCNPALGAYSENVTALVHPENRFVAERSTAISGLNVAGVTLITKSIDIPLSESGGVVMEVKAAPDFRMHLKPSKGESINPAISLMDMLFPPEQSTRVPLISITGSAGKSICAYLINFVLEKEGYSTGLACSDGLFSQGRRIIKGNMTYSENVPALIGDPDIDVAILETSVEGILDNGLGYQFADIGVFLNVFDNHLNYGDVWLKEDLAYAKSVVAEEVYESGYSVLNADCPFIMDSLKRLYSKPALFSQNPSNKEFTSHITKGGMGACLRDNKIFIHNRSGRWVIANAEEVPLLFSGKSKLMLDSVLAACCVLTALGVNPEKTGEYIKKFKVQPHTTQGRMNFVKIGNNKVLIDKAHNAKAFKEIKNLCSLNNKPLAIIIKSPENLHINEIDSFCSFLNQFSEKQVIIDDNEDIKDNIDYSILSNKSYITSLSNMPGNRNKNISEIKAKLIKLLETNGKKVTLIKKSELNGTIDTLSKNYFPVIIG